MSMRYKWQIAFRTTQIILLIALNIIFLFGGATIFRSDSVVGASLQRIRIAAQTQQFQELIVLGAYIFFLTFCLLQYYKSPGKFLNIYNRDLWLAIFLSLATINYMVRGVSDLDNTEAIMCLMGPACVQFVVWSKTLGRTAANENLFEMVSIGVTAVVLWYISVFIGDFRHIFAYLKMIRWSGPWGNPNILGLLMGAGIALMVSLGLEIRVLALRIVSSTLSSRAIYLLGTSLCALAAAFLFRGLYHSYSRGAWVATFCGMVYLAISAGKKGQDCDSSRERLVRKTVFWTFVAAVSIAILAFWHFHDTRWPIVRRAFSMTNSADFSWRNRVAAWSGAVQIMADHPWSGTGWGRAQLLYTHYYRPPKVSEGSAFRMNDYLKIGATLGIPALLSFAMYIWLSFTRLDVRRLDTVESNFIKEEDSMCIPSGFLYIGCRTATVILLIGFWFDGGFFVAATSFVFWIVIEMGRKQQHTVRLKCNPFVETPNVRVA